MREAFNVFSQAEAEADEIAKLYMKASAYLDENIKGLFDRFKRKYGLSDAEARELLEKAKNKGSIDSALQALQSSPPSEEVKQLREVVESAAFAARIARLRSLEVNADRVMNNIYKQELARNTSFYKRLARDSYYHEVFNIQQRLGLHFDFADVNPKLVNRLIHSKWSGENYSTRIWNNTQAVAESVKEEMIIGELTGKTEREMSQVLTERFAVGANASRRILRTESNYIHTMADMEAKKECGIEKYRYVATLDLKTCKDTCAKLDGRVFLVKDARAGYNCPPMHPYCRCTTVAVFDKKYEEGMTRFARDPITGKGMQVPVNMTYAEWYNKYVENNPGGKLAELKKENWKADSKQHEEYQRVLGKAVPWNLHAFQDLKYGDPEKWAELQKKYKEKVGK